MFSSCLCGSRFVRLCTHLVTVTANGDAEDVEAKPQPGDGEFVEGISLPKNDLMKRLEALVAEEHLPVGARVCSCALVPEHVSTKPPEAPSLRF